MRNRVIAMSAHCALAAATLTVGGCSGSGHAAAAGQPTNQSPTAALTCSSTYLGMSVGHQSGIRTVTQAIDVTNNGTDACVIDGYPGIDLLGIAHGSSQYSWTIQWANTPHRPVVLTPGASAHFNLVYVAAPVGASTSPGAKASLPPGAKAAPSAKPTVAPPPPQYIQVLDITITLPNTFTTDQTAWSASLVLQDKDPHPQTYVTPFVAGLA